MGLLAFLLSGWPQKTSTWMAGVYHTTAMVATAVLCACTTLMHSDRSVNASPAVSVWTTVTVALRAAQIHTCFHVVEKGLWYFALADLLFWSHRRQGKAFQGIAQSLSPFLAYYAAPVLSHLQEQIRAVAHANAEYIEKFKARHKDARQREAGHVSNSSKRPATDDCEASPPSKHAVSPFCTASYAPEAKRRSGSGAEDISTAQPPAPMQAEAGPDARQQPNPFAQVATVAFSERLPDDTARRSQSQHKAAAAVPRQPQQPVSPFATAAEASGRFSASLPETSASQGSAHALHTECSQQHQAGSAGSEHTNPGALTNATDTEKSAAGTSQPSQGDDDETSLDTYFVFKRRPILNSHVRRYSTSTIFQGVCATPRAHFRHASIVHVREETSGEMQRQSIVVDDFSYASLTQDINRRALSTPQDCAADGPLPAEEVQHTILAHASCPGPMLFDGPPGNGQLLDAEAQLSAEQNHMDIQGQANTYGTQQAGGQVSAFSPGALSSMNPHGVAGPHLRPSRLAKQLTPVEFLGKNASHSVEDHEVIDACGHGSPKHSAASRPCIKAFGRVGPPKPAPHQHPFWMTFAQPHKEEDFTLWYAQKCSKVCGNLNTLDETNDP